MSQISLGDPLQRLEFVVTAGPARPSGAFERTANPDHGTRVMFALDLHLAGLMKLMTSR